MACCLLVDVFLAAGWEGRVFLRRNFSFLSGALLRRGKKRRSRSLLGNFRESLFGICWEPSDRNERAGRCWCDIVSCVSSTFFLFPACNPTALAQETFKHTFLASTLHNIIYWQYYSNILKLSRYISLSGKNSSRITSVPIIPG